MQLTADSELAARDRTIGRDLEGSFITAHRLASRCVCSPTPANYVTVHSRRQHRTRSNGNATPRPNEENNDSGEPTPVWVYDDRVTGKGNSAFCRDSNYVTSKMRSPAISVLPEPLRWQPADGVIGLSLAFVHRQLRVRPRSSVGDFITAENRQAAIIVTSAGVKEVPRLSAWPRALWQN
ncbi:hypothetical protein TNCV_3531 [Trichonephila clavipes]|nr:hypothetical protein TNCV_3531 [Trichonephila clavipes]